MHDTDLGDLGGRRVFENAQWRNVNNNGDLDVLVIWVAEDTHLKMKSQREMMLVIWVAEEVGAPHRELVTGEWRILLLYEGGFFFKYLQGCIF